MQPPHLPAARAGKQARDAVPRAALGEVAAALPGADRDPVGIVVRQHESRLAELVPVRIGRMVQSPFAFYRGTAAIMAADLAQEATPDIRVVSCGDAHLSNFGFFASPERSLVFDLNDFDEAGVAPFEWDVKRLAASVHIGGRDRGLSEEQCREATTVAVANYRQVMLELVECSALDRYFHVIDEDAVTALAETTKDVKAIRRVTDKARRRTSEQVLAKITTRTEDGTLRIVDEPPLTQHVDHATVEQLSILFQRYRRTLREDANLLLSQFALVDYVLRVVGVGSVGTRCYVIALVGPGDATLFLQAKEAQASVLTSHGGMPSVISGGAPGTPHTEGHRVVAGQRVLQSQSDPFLGWITGWAGDREDRPTVDYYWRQFRDMKGSVEVDRLSKRQFGRYGQLCARALARAHSQSPHAERVAGYLGAGTAFEEALGSWAAAYADVAEADYAALRRAVDAGTVPVEYGL